MLVNETFVSVQGEGVLVGVPSFFIRTAGCNLGTDKLGTGNEAHQPARRFRALACPTIRYRNRRSRPRFRSLELL